MATSTHPTPAPKATGNPRIRIRRQDASLCFCEREERLHAFDAESIPGEYRYSRAFAWVMDGLSAPFEPTDHLLGSLVLGPLPAQVPTNTSQWLELVHSTLLFSPGHMTLDYGTVLQKGLRGILTETQSLAEGGGERAQIFAENSRICIEAIERWIERSLALVATVDTPSEPLQRAARALNLAPLNPARDFHSALQTCWMIHLIMSGIVGGRDFGFGRLDQLLWPFLRADLETGALDEAQARALIRDFFLKLNFLAGNGRGYPDGKGCAQPTPCTGTKQYIVLGGRHLDGSSAINPLSFWFLDTIGDLGLREPVLHVRYHPDDNTEFRDAAVQASIASQGQVQFANEVFTPNALILQGVSPEDAINYGASACSRLDLGGLHGNGELWTLPTARLRDYVEQCGEPDSFEVFLKGFREFLQIKVAQVLDGVRASREPFYDIPFVNDGGPHFHLESLFLGDCVAQAKHLCEGGGRYRLHLVNFVGLATLVDSLIAIREIVFRQRRLSLQSFDAIVKADFVGHEELLHELKALPKFGCNHPEADQLTAHVGELLVDAVERVPMPENHITMASFYSLIVHLWAGHQQPATWDGRRAGTPLSENQSAVYGPDQPGATALLNSLIHLPFDRACSGSLNLMFPRNVPAEKVRALLDVFFRKGGSMVGLTFADRAQMEDAVAHPERHPFLQVRMHGFSEYFVNMPCEEQEEVLARTSY